MTEVEWLNRQARPFVLFDYVSAKSSPRKLQLVAVAACRLLSDLETRPVLKRGIEVLERYAEGSAAEAEYVEARQAVTDLMVAGYTATERFDSSVTAVLAAMETVAAFGTRLAIGSVIEPNPHLVRSGRKVSAHQAIKRVINGILREIVGNPFRPYLAVPNWQGGGVIQPDGRTVPFTDAVKGIADAVHVTGDFGRLPILADALEEAGVTDEVLLSHCRDGGPHLRGCWALDVVRGRG